MSKKKRLCVRTQGEIIINSDEKLETSEKEEKQHQEIKKE